MWNFQKYFELILKETELVVPFLNKKSERLDIIIKYEMLQSH